MQRYYNIFDLLSTNCGRFLGQKKSGMAKKYASRICFQELIHIWLMQKKRKIEYQRQLTAAATFAPTTILLIYNRFMISN